MLSMLSALELLLFSLSFGGGLMLKEYKLSIPLVQYWMPVPHLAGEGEWLREVEERAGESKRALWVISRVLMCNLMVCVDVAPSYLRIRRPINKFGKILFQAVEILMIRMGWKIEDMQHYTFFLSLSDLSLSLLTDRPAEQERGYYQVSMKLLGWYVFFLLMNSLCGLGTLGERGARPFFCLKHTPDAVIWSQVESWESTWWHRPALL